MPRPEYPPALGSRLATGSLSPARCRRRSRRTRRPPASGSRPARWKRWSGSSTGRRGKQEGGCFYPLPVDSITLARRAKARQVEEALARAGMKSDWPAEPEDTGGVLIHVDVGVGAEERPSELAFATLGSWVGNDSLLTAATPEDGWDYRRSLPGKPNFYGRAGTVMVVVQGGTYGMEDTTMATLAARVRDRIPDLPFPVPNAAASAPPGPDPCSVLSRAEAESVLGPLVVGPYRVREGGALADPRGESCAYYSGKHRALLLTPHFTNGAGEMRFSTGTRWAGSVGVVDREAEGADTLEGPWDEAAIGVDGQLAMLKGAGCSRSPSSPRPRISPARFGWRARRSPRARRGTTDRAPAAREELAMATPTEASRPRYLGPPTASSSSRRRPGTGAPPGGSPRSLPSLWR